MAPAFSYGTPVNDLPVDLLEPYQSCSRLASWMCPEEQKHVMCEHARFKSKLPIQAVEISLLPYFSMPLRWMTTFAQCKCEYHLDPTCSLVELFLGDSAAFDLRPNALCSHYPTTGCSMLASGRAVDLLRTLLSLPAVRAGPVLP